MLWPINHDQFKRDVISQDRVLAKIKYHNRLDAGFDIRKINVHTISLILNIYVIINYNTIHLIKI